jgi:hypothetical protein
MRGIFISYRREDSEGQAGRLYNDLSARFGRDAVFMDVADIKKGLDFRRIIYEHVTSCGVLLVIIGKRWTTVTDSKGGGAWTTPTTSCGSRLRPRFRAASRSCRSAFRMLRCRPSRTCPTR